VAQDHQAVQWDMPWDSGIPTEVKSFSNLFLAAIMMESWEIGGSGDILFYQGIRK